MENVIKILRLKLRNERLYRAYATQWLNAHKEEAIKAGMSKHDGDSLIYKSSLYKEYLAIQESHDNASKMIPQFEQAIKLLTEWKDK